MKKVVALYMLLLHIFLLNADPAATIPSIINDVMVKNNIEDKNLENLLLEYFGYLYDPQNESLSSVSKVETSFKKYLDAIKESGTAIASDCAMYTDLQSLLILPIIGNKICESGTSESGCVGWFTSGTSNPVQYYLMSKFCKSLTGCEINTDQNSIACKISNAVNLYLGAMTTAFTNALNTGDPSSLNTINDMISKDLIPLFSASDQPNIFQAVMARFINNNLSLYNWWNSVSSNFNNAYNSGNKFFLGLCIPDNQSARSQAFQTYIVPALLEIAPVCSWYTAGNLQEITNITDFTIEDINFDNSPKALSSGGLPFEDFSSADSIINNVLLYYFFGAKYLNSNLGGLSSIQGGESPGNACPYGVINQALFKPSWAQSYTSSSLFSGNKTDAQAYGFLTAFWNTIFSSWFAKYILNNGHKYTNNGQPLSPDTIYDIYNCAGQAANGKVAQFAKEFCGCTAHYWDSSAMWNLLTNAFNDTSFLVRYNFWIYKYFYMNNTTMYWNLSDICQTLGVANCSSVGFF